MMLVLQKALQALVDFLCEFVISHPRIICSILGCLGALALIACVAAINILWR